MKRTLTKHLPILFFALAPITTPLRAQLETVVVVNAATSEVGFPVAPGSWATAFADFGSVGVATDLLATQAGVVPPFPTMLNGVQVFVDGAAAPMNFVGPQQVNFIIPGDTSTDAPNQASLRITVNGAEVFIGGFNVWPISPGLFGGFTGEGLFAAAALNQDFTVNSPGNPAARGSVVQLFGAGAQYSSLPADGDIATADPLIGTTLAPTAEVSVVDAVVQFSGLAPGLANVWQVNIIIPESAVVLPGAVAVTIRLGGLATNRAVIWVE